MLIMCFEIKFKFIMLWKTLPALVALIWVFPKVCCHVALKMTFVVKALSLAACNQCTDILFLGMCI